VEARTRETAQKVIAKPSEWAKNCKRTARNLYAVNVDIKGKPAIACNHDAPSATCQAATLTEEDITGLTKLFW